MMHERKDGTWLGTVSSGDVSRVASNSEAARPYAGYSLSKCSITQQVNQIGLRSFITPRAFFCHSLTIHFHSQNLATFLKFHIRDINTFAGTRSRSNMAPIFQGSHAPASRQKFDEVAIDDIDSIINTLDTYSTLWEDYRDLSIRRAIDSQSKLDARFEIGQGWKRQRDAFRSQFTGTNQEFQEHLRLDKAFHSTMAEICAAEAMVTISHKFIDAFASLYGEQQDNTHIHSTEIMDATIFDFAGPLQSAKKSLVDFINDKALPWIQSHGPDAFETPTLNSVENIRVFFWNSFKQEDTESDKCSEPGHKLGARPWDCGTCVLDVVLSKYGIPRPAEGRLRRHRPSTASSTSSDSSTDFITAPSNASGAVPVVTAAANPPPIMNVNAPTTQAGPGPQPFLAPPAPPAAQVPAAAQFKPVYTQIRANGGNQLVPVQASLLVADILARSRNLPATQKHSRLTLVGGVRYLCCYGPANNKCACYFQCRPDLAKHGRVDHGVAAFAPADWAEIGPYNVDEMRLLRPGHSFILRSTKDPAHMR